MNKNVTHQDIYEALERIAPFSTQLSWDNSGFLIGAKHVPVTSCVVALDVTPEVIAFAKEKGASLIISHHPVIFSPLKAIEEQSVVWQAVCASMSIISAHTNLDLANGGVNDALADALGLSEVRLFENEEQLGRIGRLPHPTTAQEFAEEVKHKLVPNGHVSFCAGTKPIETVAVVGGSGGDLIAAAAACGADAYVTGEVRHHEWLIARELGLTMVCAGHAETESVVLRPLARMLADEFETVSFYVYEQLPVSYC